MTRKSQPSAVSSTFWRTLPVLVTGAALLLLAEAVSACGGTSTAAADGGAVAADGGAVAADGGGAIDDAGPPDAGLPFIDAGPGTTGECTALDGGTACNSLDIGAAPVVTRVHVATAAPVLGGGTINPGLYYRTASTAYTGPGGSEGPEAGDLGRWVFRMDVSGNALSIQATQEKSGCFDRETLAVTIASPMLSGASSCPTVEAFTARYSANTTTFVFEGDTGKHETFTRQGP